jgi:hypothetical protein
MKKTELDENEKRIEIINCRECGIFMLSNGIEFCNRCSDPYYLEEHHGG